jgi:TRAP-type C4-dicarboxylate transport system permease small subunit
MARPVWSRGWRAVERVLDGVAAVERWVCAALLVVIFAAATAQVFMRYVMSAPLAASDEVARFTLIWVTFLAAALTQNRDEHIAVLIIRARGGAKRRAVLHALANVVALLTAVLVVYLGIETMDRSARVTSPSLEISMSLVYLSVVLGFLLIALHSVRNLVNLARYGKVSRDAGEHLADEMQLT